MSHYKHHVFFCTNHREDGRQSCQQCDAQRLRSYAKARSKELGLAGVGGVRMNTAGCLDRCEYGPVVVIYPDEIWYTYVDEADIDEIIESHIQNGKIVERLLIDA